MDYLAILNPHERDLNISFDAGPHKYTIKGQEDCAYTSVTTWNHGHFAEFDADAIISNMMKGKGWAKSKYFGQTPAEIKAGWDLNRDEAAAAGTQLHYQIECYYNNVHAETLDASIGEASIGEASIGEASIEYTYFQNFITACPDLKPYRTEWTVYHEEVRIAGSIDMVYENPDGTLMIYDWKRAKDIVKASAFMKYAKTECIAHLPDTNFWHYALQLNTYKAILEQKYGKKVVKLALVCLHPTKKNFEVIVLPILTQEIADLFALRLAQVQQAQAQVQQAQAQVHI
jgi:hypothetical protein